MSPVLPPGRTALGTSVQVYKQIAEDTRKTMLLRPLQDRADAHA